MKNASSQNSRKAPKDRVGRDSTNPQQKPYELIKLGVDTHAGQYTFARMIDNQGMQPVQKLSPEKFLQFLEKQLQMAKRVVMVYEAGPYGFSLYRQVSELKVECLVCAPEHLGRGRKRVNDKSDARELLNRLDRHLAGNATALRLVRPPTIEQEISRRLARERNTYRKDRQRWIGRGRSLLHTLGIARPGRWEKLKRRSELLEQIQKRYGQKVHDALRTELDHYQEILQMIEGKLAELTKSLRDAAGERAEARVKGVGALSNELLDREVVDWNRFRNRRQVGSFFGLCPGEDSTGDSRMMLSIDKHGNPRVRALLVELSWLLPKFQPDYKPLQRWKWLFDEHKPGPASLRKKAAVALARRLAIDLWRIKTGRAKPEEVGLRLAA